MYEHITYKYERDYQNQLKTKQIINTYTCSWDLKIVKNVGKLNQN